MPCRKPVRWFAIPQLYRYERAQRGRLREHFQLNVDIVGEADVRADAELVACAVDMLRGFGLTHDDIVVRFSDRRVLNALLKHFVLVPEQYAAGVRRSSTRSTARPPPNPRNAWSLPAWR